MPGESKIMTDHDKIRKWAEARGGHPATVAGTGGDRAAGLLRIDFPGYRGKQSLQEISWDEFFKKFEEKNLAVLYQERTATGRDSRFFKFVNRDGERARGGGRRTGPMRRESDDNHGERSREDDRSERSRSERDPEREPSMSGDRSRRS